MDEETYWILRMLSEHRISVQMAERLLDGLKILRKSEGKEQPAGINDDSMILEAENESILPEYSEMEEINDIESKDTEDQKPANTEIADKLYKDMDSEVQQELDQVIEDDTEENNVETGQQEKDDNEIQEVKPELTDDDKYEQQESNDENQLEEAYYSREEELADIEEPRSFESVAIDFGDIQENQWHDFEYNDEIEDKSDEGNDTEVPSFILPTIADKHTISKSSVDYSSNESASANEFRRLIRNVIHSDSNSDVRSILITSSIKNEGKSLVAANLAIALAKREKDKKVLLLDCDLRKPVIHSLFGIGKEPGLVSLILEEINLRSAVYDTGLGNLKVIPSGRTTDSPSILLPDIKNVIDNCKNWFDIILCDSPPVVPVDDAATMGQYADGVLFVIMAGKTDRMIVKRALDILNEAKVTILGIALNNVHGTLPYYYDYKHYGYKPEKNGD